MLVFRQRVIILESWGFPVAFWIHHGECHIFGDDDYMEHGELEHGDDSLEKAFWTPETVGSVGFR